MLKVGDIFVADLKWCGECTFIIGKVTKSENGWFTYDTIFSTETTYNKTGSFHEYSKLAESCGPLTANNAGIHRIQKFYL